MFTNIKITPKSHTDNYESHVSKCQCVIQRGFISIDQEMEREIAMQRFSHLDKTISAQKSFLMRTRG